MTASVATVASGDGTANYTVAVPSGTTDGDLLVAVAASDWNTLVNNNVPAAFLTGTGGVTLGTSDFDGGTNAVHLALGARIAASEPANYTFTVGGGADHVAAILRITGHEGTPTIAQVAPATVSAGTGVVNAPSITPNGADDLLLCFGVVDGANGGGANTWTVTGAGLTEHIDRQSTTWTSLVVASLANPSSPSGTKTLTTSPSSHGAGCAAAISVASAGGAAPGVPIYMISSYGSFH